MICQFWFSAAFVIVLWTSWSSADPTPHLRVGDNYLQPETTLMVSNINRSHLLFCDAFEPVSMLSYPEFNGIVWRFGNNNSLIYSIPVVVTNSTYRLYSIGFAPYKGFQNSDNVLLQCCTTLNGTNVMCQASYVIVDPSYYSRINQITCTKSLISISFLVFLSYWVF